VPARSDQERDAVLAAAAAVAMIDRAAGWIDLVNCERDPIFIIGRVGYWLPLSAS
jgi:hypothetical protein